MAVAISAILILIQELQNVNWFHRLPCSAGETTPVEYDYHLNKRYLKVHARLDLPGGLKRKQVGGSVKSVGVIPEPVVVVSPSPDPVLRTGDPVVVL